MKINLKKIAIDTAARMIMNGQIFVDAKMFVKTLINDDNLSKQEKHEKVKHDLVLIFGEIGNTLLDIAIKLAVLYFQAEQEKK